MLIRGFIALVVSCSLLIDPALAQSPHRAGALGHSSLESLSASPLLFRSFAWAMHKSPRHALSLLVLAQTSPLRAAAAPMRFSDQLATGGNIVVFVSMAVQVIAGALLGAWGSLALHEWAHASILERHGIDYVLYLEFPMGYVEVRDDEVLKLQRLPLATRVWFLVKPAVVHGAMALGSVAVLWSIVQTFDLPWFMTILYTPSILLWGVINGLNALVNLIPFKAHGYENDGLKVYRLLRNTRGQPSILYNA